jgi:pyruvate,water dikinase
MTDPDWEPIMKSAAAIVTNRGGRTCHAAIISRELGIPCVVGAGDATEKLEHGRMATVDCSQGAAGYVYDGEVAFETRTTDLKELPEIKTQIMLNLASPEQAFEKSFLPNSGVGLAREEFIINSHIKIHPLALLRFDELSDRAARRVIEDMTRGYESKAEYFVDKLAEGVAMIAAAFYPKKVIVRLLDFKTNEYANLIGGAQFEPREDNPMIGWRGASRYYAEAYREAFGLECKAMLKVRNDMGLTNVEIMIPFCRTLSEARKVIETMASFGLRQGENGLKVIGMCEIPSNVILADQFLDIFDGFSIGTNDLTQLLLGVDRDSELVADVYDERDESVKLFVKQVIETALRKGKYIGICGQAPSDHVEFAQFIVECGIESMSLNPDTELSTWMAVADLEKDLERRD